MSTPSLRDSLAGLRVNITEAAKLANLNLGQLVVMRSKGAKLFDPSFPPMTNGTFDAAAVMAWKAARDAKAVGGAK